MKTRLEKIKDANEVLNHNNPAWKEELDWVIKQAEETEQLRKSNKELDRFNELTKIFKYAVEYTQDFSEFYHYMSDIVYSKSFNDLKK
jgi:hypothetical protein